jgi:hypothetical protein
LQRGVRGAGRSAPAISPDEKQITFMRYNPGGLPVLTLFDFGAADGTPVTHVPGFMAAAQWR